MFRIYYTIQWLQCTYSKYVVHMYIYKCVCVHYIYQCVCALYIPILQTCYRAPEGLYIYISQQWDGVPLNSLTSKGTILDCLKAWMPAAVGDIWWHDLTLLAIHSLMLISPKISPVMHVPQKRTPHNPQQTEIISNHCFCSFFPVILRLAEPTHGALPVHRRSLREQRQHCVQWWCWWLDIYIYIDMFQWWGGERIRSPWKCWITLPPGFLMCFCFVNPDLGVVRFGRYLTLYL